MPSSSSSSSTRSSTCASESATDGQVQRGGDRVAHLEAALERDARSSRATVSAGNSRPSWNERPSPRRARAAAPRRRDVARVPSPSPSTIVPLSAGEEAGDDVEQRGLARAVRADEAEDLARRDRERHVAQRGRGRRSASTRRASSSRAAARRRVRAPLRGAARSVRRRRRAPRRRRHVGRRRSPARRGRCVAAPSRNTERSTSGRSSSSAVGPWNRISPFSMKYAVSAMVSARFTDCSTRMIVVPCVADVAHDREQLLDDRRARARATARRSSAGAAASMNAMPSVEHLLLAAREVAGGLVEPLAQHREQLEHVLDRARACAPCPCGAASPRGAGSRRRSATGTRPGRPAPARRRARRPRSGGA